MGKIENYFNRKKAFFTMEQAALPSGVQISEWAQKQCEQDRLEAMMQNFGYKHPPFAMTDDAIHKLVLRINLFGDEDDRRQLALQGYIGKARITELDGNSHVAV